MTGNDIKKQQYSMSGNKTQSPNDVEYGNRIGDYFSESIGLDADKLKNFTKFVPRQAIASFLAKNLIFDQILHMHGCIVECGVYLGGGLMTWAQLSAIYEPYNHNRRIIGFDSFEGFPAISAMDGAQTDNPQLKIGALAALSADKDLERCIELYDLNRPIPQIPRVEIIKGDALQTMPDYVNKNKHTVVSLLYLDFDLYEPTKIALEVFLPRMPKGAIIAFDELNQREWPGETLAVLEVLGIRNVSIKRFPFMPQISYCVLE
jgi:hypothetical protein